MNRAGSINRDSVETTPEEPDVEPFEADEEGDDDLEQGGGSRWLGPTEPDPCVSRDGSV
ncbi:MAG TPA: hypothetical protein VGB18_03890 [Candidatus Thermoplasmatota archaeon]